jgi:hypothetical protein
MSATSTTDGPFSLPDRSYDETPGSLICPGIGEHRLFLLDSAVLPVVRKNSVRPKTSVDKD